MFEIEFCFFILSFCSLQLIFGLSVPLVTTASVYPLMSSHWGGNSPHCHIPLKSSGWMRGRWTQQNSAGGRRGHWLLVGWCGLLGDGEGWHSICGSFRFGGQGEGSAYDLQPSQVQGASWRGNQMIQAYPRPGGWGRGMANNPLLFQDWGQGRDEEESNHFLICMFITLFSHWSYDLLFWSWFRLDKGTCSEIAVSDILITSLCARKLMFDNLHCTAGVVCLRGCWH